MRDRARRAIAECLHIAAMTEEPGRITRRFLTPPVQDVHAHLRRRMEALGMDVRTDSAGNLRGIWPAQTSHRRLVLGSHIDTVPDAGAYDGALGVTLALEWAQLVQEAALPIAIEVIAFSEEEGVRFGLPFIGSRAVAGRFDPDLQWTVSPASLHFRHKLSPYIGAALRGQVQETWLRGAPVYRRSGGTDNGDTFLGDPRGREFVRS